MSIFRRRLMMGGKKPIEYLEFEDRRVWEICAYRWGYTYNLQEVDGVGGVLGNGVIAGNDDTIVYCDHMFAASYAIGAHGSVPATAARTVQYRVELYVNGSPSAAGAPWEIATPATATNSALHIVQYGTTMSVTELKKITLESWADASYWESQTDLTYNADKGCWECLVTVTNACQYLRIGLRAAAGVSVSWKVVSVGVTKVPQGITTAQCAAVSSLGTFFRQNSLIKMFDEFVLFTGVSNLPNNCFRESSIEEITLPASIRSITNILQFNKCRKLNRLEVSEGTTSIQTSQWIWEATNLRLLILPSTISDLCSDALATHGSANTTTVICKAVTPPTKTNTSYYNNVAAVYVPDESVDAYKAATGWSQWATKIKPLSEYVN